MELRRGVDPELLSALSQSSYPVLFAWLDWPGEAVRVHTGVGTLTWGGHNWTGVGLLGNIEIPPESHGVAALEAILALAGLPDTVEDFADDAIRNRTAALYLGALAERPGGYDGNQPGTLVGEPTQLFIGLMDGLTLTVSQTDDGVAHEARVTVMTGVEARSAASIYHTDEDQRRKYPGDTAGRHVIMAMANAQKLRWPEN